MRSQSWTVLRVMAVLGLGVAGVAGCGGSTGSNGATSADAKPHRGGSITIARREDSQSFDKTNTFQNESVWLLEQINETLYTAGKDGKTLKPWLATGYTRSPDGKTYTFKLRPGVKFSNGQALTSADVKFSIQDTQAQRSGWGYIDAPIKRIDTPSPGTVVFHLKYRWAPFVADMALFANGIVPKGFAGETRANFYKHPIGTGPFVWGNRQVGRSVTLKRNPTYWQPGKPYLDSVTWTFVSDDNTRELQLRGGQIDVDEFPPFSAITKLQSTPGVKLSLFPSTRIDYLLMNQSYGPLADVHVRRAISYAIDRSSIVKSVLFGHGTVANSLFPPTVPFYDSHSPGIQYDMAQAKAELAQSGYPRGFKVEMLIGAGAQVESTVGQILQQSLGQLGIGVTFRKVDTSTEFNDIGVRKYQIALSQWTMDIVDPDELSTFAVDPQGNQQQFYTGWRNPAAIAASRKAQRESSPALRTQLYAQVQRLAANDAFLGFLYYSPFRWAYTNKLHGFDVYPLGNYHLEDAWLG